MNQIISLWSFSCKIYSLEGVEAHCLRLQEQYQANIPLILLGCWCGVYSFPITQPDKLRSLAEQWSERCIIPLRQLRQTMKSHHQGNTWEDVREQVKETELLAEKSLLKDLETLIDRSKATTTAISNNDIFAPFTALMPELLRQPQAYPSLEYILHAAKTEREQYQQSE